MSSFLMKGFLAPILRDNLRIGAIFTTFLATLLVKFYRNDSVIAFHFLFSCPGKERRGKMQRKQKITIADKQIQPVESF